MCIRDRLCSLILNGLGDSIQKMNLDPGDEYQIITIDINPYESYQLANQKKIITSKSIILTTLMRIGFF